VNKQLLLDAVVKEIDYIFFRLREDGLPEIFSKNVVATPVPLKSIANAVSQEPSEDLQISVLTEMQFPVLLVKNTPEEHKAAIAGLRNKLPYDPSMEWLTVIGNQRTEIARKHDFTHIDAFIVDTGVEAVILKKQYDEESAIK